jgi:hypothetical protein
MASTSLFLGLTLTPLVQTPPSDSVTLERALARARETIEARATRREPADVTTGGEG